jgi:peptidyl-prolyl cis-trans isomerase NIMA-interacting 1
MGDQSWTKRISRSRGVPYYYHTMTGANTWERPSEYDSDTDMGLPTDSQQLARADDSSSAAAESAATDDAGPSRVQAAHILLKHTGSRNPVSRRTGEAARLSEAEATADIEAIERELRQLPEGSEQRLRRFQEIARERSDCSRFVR